MIIIICLSCLTFYCSYKIFVDPFGWISRCPHKRTLVLQNELRFKLLGLDETTSPAYAAGFVRDYDLSIGDYEDLLTIDYERPSRLPKNCSIIALQDGNIYVLVIRDDVGDIREIEPEVSYKGYLILVKKTVSSTNSKPAKELACANVS